MAIAQAGSVAPYQLVWGPRVRAFVGDLVAIENRGATNRFYFVVARGWGRAEPVEWLDSSTDSCGYSASVGQRVEARVVVHRDGRRTFSIADLERGSAGGRLAQRWGRPRWVRDLDEAAREASRREVRQRIALGSADCLLPAQTMRFVVPDTARDYGLPDGALSEAEGRERGTLLWSPRSSPEQVNAILLLLPRVAGCWQRVRGEIRCRSDERCQRLTRCRNLLGEHAAAAATSCSSRPSIRSCARARTSSSRSSTCPIRRISPTERRSRPAQRPVQAAGRLARKAATPSSLSAEEKQRQKRSRS